LFSDREDNAVQKFWSSKKYLGYNPIFNQEFEFKYYNPMFSFLMIKVWDASNIKKEMIG